MKPKTASILLWVAQAILAPLFLFAGSMKLIMPIEQMQGAIALPGPFLRFIGVVEVLGGIGLLLPAILRIQPRLTPLAASGLTIIMIGAVSVTALGGDWGHIAIPFVVGLLTLFIAYGRTRLAPRTAR